MRGAAVTLPILWLACAAAPAEGGSLLSEGPRADRRRRTQASLKNAKLHFAAPPVYKLPAALSQTGTGGSPNVDPKSVKDAGWTRRAMTRIGPPSGSVTP